MLALINVSAVIPLYFTNPRAANGAAPKIHTHDTVSDNRNLHISGLLNEEKVDIGDSEVWTFKTKKWILEVCFSEKAVISQ